MMGEVHGTAEPKPKTTSRSLKFWRRCTPTRKTGVWGTHRNF